MVASLTHVLLIPTHSVRLAKRLKAELANSQKNKQHWHGFELASEGEVVVSKHGAVLASITNANGNINQIRSLFGEGATILMYQSLAKAS